MRNGQRVILTTMLQLPIRCALCLVLAGIVAKGAAVRAALVLTSPVERQVFQRDAAHGAVVPVRGSVTAAADAIEVRAAPQPGRSGAVLDWTAVSVSVPAGSFSGSVRLYAGGWYWLEVRVLRNGAVSESARLERVGIGEVFITCGQSNSTSCGYPPNTVQSDMVSAFDGSRWTLANDPQPGAFDTCTGGSVYPMLGDRLVGALRVPVAFSTTGRAGAMLEAWLVEYGDTLYYGLRDRIRALGTNRPRCILWHQGESNAVVGTTQPPDQYGARLVTLKQRINLDVGYTLPWITCKATYIPEGAGFGPWPNPVSETIRAQQQWLWDSGNTFPGPDTDAYREGYRHDGVHFNTQGFDVFSNLYLQAIVVAFGLVPPPSPSPTPTPGGMIVVDDGDPAYSTTGAWSHSDGAGAAAYNGDYDWTTTAEVETRQARWAPDLPAGTYDVAVMFRQGTNRATDAPYSVIHRNGTTLVRVDQTVNGGTWVPLGRFEFNAGASGFVLLANGPTAVTGRAVIADAVRWMMAPSPTPTYTPTRTPTPFATWLEIR